MAQGQITYGTLVTGSTFTAADANMIATIVNNKEDYLSVPASNGYVLSSNTSGTRSWIAPPSATTWGSITGTLSSQTDLYTAMGLLAPIANPTFTGTVNVGSLTYTTGGAIYVGQSSNSSYNQFILQNSSSGTGASSDHIVNNNLSTDTTYYGDFGINSSTFIGSGSLNLPNAVYITSTTGELVHGTTTSNGMHFVVNSSTTDAMSISAAGVTTIASLIVTGATTLSVASSPNFVDGYTTTVSAAGTTTLSTSSTCNQYITGTTTQTVVLPLTSTLILGQQYIIYNRSTGLVTVQSNGLNNVTTIPAGCTSTLTALSITLNTAAAWDAVLAEPALGNPSTNGYVLSSTTAGVRSWISVGGSMTWPVGVSGTIPSNGGSSNWGTSYTVSGSGTVVALATGATLTGATYNGNTLTTGSSTYTGTAAAVYTFPGASKTIAANDGSNWTITSQAIGDIAVASSTTAYSRLAAVAAGSVLISAGTGTAPTWSATPTLTSVNKVTITAPASSATLTIANTGSLITTGAFAITLNATATSTVTLPASTSATLNYYTTTPAANAIGYAGSASGLITYLAVPSVYSILTATTGTGLPAFVTATGTGAPVAATSPTLVTPTLGVATATSINGNTITASTGTLTLAASSSLITTGAFAQTLTATAASTVTMPASTSATMNYYTTAPAQYGLPYAGAVSGLLTYLAVPSVLSVLTGTTGSAPAWSTATGTGSPVFSAGPTLTGTITAATANFSGLVSAPNVISGYTTTTVSGITVTLTNLSNSTQIFTGNASSQVITLPVASTMILGQSFTIINNTTPNSTGGYLSLTINSSGGNLVQYVCYSQSIEIKCILTSGTTAASWYASPLGMIYNTTQSNYVLGAGTSPNQTFQSLTTGTFNVAFGTGNVYYSISTGTGNTGVGWEACQDLTIGNYNTAVGYQAANDMQSSSWNTAMGAYSLNNLGISADGSQNVAIGSKAGYSCSGSNNNTYLGFAAGYTNATAGGNIYIGNCAGYYLNTVNTFCVGNTLTGSAANDVTYSLMYGVMNATPTSQFLDFNATVSAYHLSGANASGGYSATTYMPTQVAGTGAGTSPTISLTTGSNDIAGQISVLTGSSPTGSNAIISTITYNFTYTSTNPFVSITPANAAAAALTGATQVYANSSALTTFVIYSGSTALTAATTYLWNYHVIH